MFYILISTHCEDVACERIQETKKFMLHLVLVIHL